MRDRLGRFVTGSVGNPYGRGGRRPPERVLSTELEREKEINQSIYRAYSHIDWNRLVLIPVEEYKEPRRKKKASQKTKDALFEEQDGKCAICEKCLSDDWRIGAVLDHDHATGKTRGLLDQGCNKALGFIKDDPGTALRMYEYLTKHGSKPG